MIRLTEEDTTSSSRIFIKILFQELAETLGLVSLNKRLSDPLCLVRLTPPGRRVWRGVARCGCPRLNSPP